MIGVLARATVYATVFVGFVLVYLPARALSWAGVAGPDRIGAAQAAGLAIASAGAALAVWCVLTFAIAGRGTPAPFDPPRRLVVRGPYRYVRNPIYLGAAIAVGGAAVYYQAPLLLAYVVAFLLVMHLFVVLYEEPTLRRSFGPAYDAYCRDVRRWRPSGLSGAPASNGY